MLFKIHLLGESQHLLSLDRRLAAVLKGGASSPSEQLALADLCLRYKGRPAEAVRLYAAAFSAQPKQTDDPRLSFRFDAAHAPDEHGLCQLLDAKDVSLFDVSFQLMNEGRVLEYRANLRTRRRDGLAQLSERLRREPGLREFDLARISR